MGGGEGGLIKKNILTFFICFKVFGAKFKSLNFWWKNKLFSWNCWTPPHTVENYTDIIYIFNDGFPKIEIAKVLTHIMKHRRATHKNCKFLMEIKCYIKIGLNCY